MDEFDNIVSYNLAIEITKKCKNCGHTKKHHHPFLKKGKRKCEERRCKCKNFEEK